MTSNYTFQNNNYFSFATEKPRQMMNFYNDNAFDFSHRINTIRYILFSKFYNDQNFIASLKSYIEKYIDCLSISYDNFRCCFYIKIRKTDMKRRYSSLGFKSKGTNSSLYYRIAGSIFMDFIRDNSLNIIEYLKSMFPSEYYIGYLSSIPEAYYSNFCNIFEYSDNLIVIKL